MEDAAGWGMVAFGCVAMVSVSIWCRSLFQRTVKRVDLLEQFLYRGQGAEEQPEQEAGGESEREGGGAILPQHGGG